MLHRTILVLLLVLTPTMSRAFGLDQVPSLPDSVLASITVRSPAELVEKVDAYTVGSTKATASALPPGLVTMLSQMYLPFPFALWQSEEPAHVVLVPDEAGNSYLEVGVFRVEAYETFMNDLQDNGWTTGEPNAEENEDGLQPILAPNGQALVVADLGDGSVVVAKTAYAIRRAILDQDWRPEYSFDTDTDAVIVIPMFDGASALVGRFNKAIDDSQSAFVDFFKEYNISETFGQGVLSLIRTYGPKLVGLLEDWRGGVLEISVDGQNIVFDAIGQFTENSLLHQIAVQADENSDLDFAAAPNFAADAVSVGVGVSVEKVLKNGRERLTALNRDAATALFPDLAEQVTALNDAAWNAGLGQTSMANFIQGTRQASFTHYRSDNPEALADAFHRGISLLNAMAERMSTDPELGVTVTGGPTTVQGRDVYAYEFDFANLEHFQEWVNRLVAMGNPELSNMTIVRVNEDFRIFMEALDNGVIFAAGDLTADEFAERVADTVNGPEKTFLEQTPVANIVDALRPRQISVALLDAAGLMYMTVLQNVNAYDMVLKPGQINPLRAALPRFTDELIRNGAAIGFAIGADNGFPTGRIIMPALAVNCIVQNQELYSRIQREEMARIMRESQQQLNPDGPVDDGAPDDENEGEEIVLDEEPGAA